MANLTTLVAEGSFEATLRKQINDNFSALNTQADATDVTLTALGGYYKRALVTLTNSQIKAMRATPVELVAAPGAGKILVFHRAILKLNAGTNVLTESADNMAIKYENGAGVAVSDTIEATGFIDAAADTYTSAVAVKDAIVAETGCANKALVLHNTGDGEYAGNAANDATLAVEVFYGIVDAIA